MWCLSVLCIDVVLLWFYGELGFAMCLWFVLCVWLSSLCWFLEEVEVLCSVVLLGGGLELLFSGAFGLWRLRVSGVNWSYKAVGLWSSWSLELLVSGTGLLSSAL